MRNIEEIRNNYHLSSIIEYPDLLVGNIQIHGWIGSFVCGLDEDGWEHVSVAPAKKHYTPSWDDMCLVKSIFWRDDEECYQIHPKADQYVNMVNNCLHIWRHKNFELPHEGRRL